MPLPGFALPAPSPPRLQSRHESKRKLRKKWWCPVTQTFRSYWRVCWLTTLIVAALNAGVFAIYASAPLVHEAHGRGKGGSSPDVPDWLETAAAALNLPGLLISGPIIIPRAIRLDPLTEMAVFQITATIFWTCFAAFSKWVIDIFLKRPSAQTPVSSASRMVLSGISFREAMATHHKKPGAASEANCPTISTGTASSADWRSGAWRSSTGRRRREPAAP